MTNKPGLFGLESVWYLAKDVLAIEKVQRRASRLALGRKSGQMEYEDRLRKLKWPTLETHNLFLSLVECYKIVFSMTILTIFLILPRVEPAKCNPYK